VRVEREDCVRGERERLLRRVPGGWVAGPAAGAARAAQHGGRVAESALRKFPRRRPKAARARGARAGRAEGRTSKAAGFIPDSRRDERVRAPASVTSAGRQ